MGDGLFDWTHLFTSGEKLSGEVMTLRLQAGSGTLNLDASRAPDRASVPQTLEQTEIETLQRAITAAHGNLSAAARLLNTTRPKLAYRARKHGLIA